MIEINCCVLALIAFIGNIIQLVFFFNYSLKIKDKNIELEKQEIKHNQRIKELESDLSLVKTFNKGLQKKNGAEQRQINELKAEIQSILLALQSKDNEIEKLKEKQEQNLSQQ